MNNKAIKEERFFIAVFVLCIGVILMKIVGHWVVYWIFYTPFYARFPDSLYLPFYLHHAGMILLCLFILLWAAACVWKKPRTKSGIAGAIFLGGIAITGSFFGGRSLCRDMEFIGHGKYMTAECNINTLEKNRHRGSSYWIDRTETVYGERIIINMNFYQYRKLVKLREEDNDRILTVHYLPNTGIMLKYE
jgi:hypothetical protein